MNRNSGKTEFCPPIRRVWVITALALMLVPVLYSGAQAEVITFEDNWGQAGFNLVDQKPYGVDVIFSVPTLQVTDIEIDGETMQNVTIPGVILPNEAGAPNLPGTARYIAIPEGAQVTMEIVKYRSEVYHNLDIAPAFEIPRGDYDGPLVYKKDRDIYETDAVYPAAPVAISERAQMRGVDVVKLGFTPFQYNPVTRELTVYQDIHVHLSFNGGSGYFGEDRLRSRWWEPILENSLLNYTSLPQIDFNLVHQTDEDNVEYIILVPNDPIFIAWADTLKRWRNEQGILTGITTLAEIGGNDATLIENYIDNAYNTWDIPPVAFLILSDYQDTGDRYGITTPMYGGYTPSDNMYADVDGDNLPDLISGRITAQSEEHLSIMINKMLSYEREPYTDPDFYIDPLIAGGWQSDRWFILCCEVLWGYFNNVQDKRPERQYSGTSGAPSSWSTNSNTYMIVDYFGPAGLGYIPETPSHLTNWGGNAAAINALINSGTFIVQHRDHGSPTSWGDPSYSVSNVYQLTNDMYPYVFSTNCSSGDYTSGSECLAEAFHRFEHGALGVNAASSTSYSFVNDVYVWGMYDCMWPDFDPYYPAQGADPVGEQNLRPGFANVYGKYYLEVSNWPSNPSSKGITYNLFHHHGGAFMTLYSEVPQDLVVIHDDIILGGLAEFTVSADQGALIGLSVDGELLASAEATGGPVTLQFEPLTPGQIMRVTVTKGNYYRYIADVDVIPPSGPWVTFEACDVADDILGNNNGQLDFGETSHLTLTAENIGIENATAVTLNISTSDPLLTILDNTEFVGDIAAGQFGTADHGFSVALDASVEDGDIISMQLEAVSDTTWISNFALVAHAPVCEYATHLIDDPAPGNQNGNLDPGETGTITVSVTNAGSSTVPDLLVNLTTTDPFLTLSTGSVNVGTVLPGGTAEVTYDVEVMASCPQEHIATFDLTFSGGGYSGDDSFDLTIGDVLYNPTGPDTYGYVAYDPFDAPELPVYDWVEICADSGGPGTRVNFTEDEQVLYCLLPFTLQYYGVGSDTLSMGANGWIAPGRVTEDDYSNSGIPNSDGPAAMIAPYWEDLSPQRTNSGGVWQWYDEANHRFIVEYNHVEQYAPTGSFETFQVILFDPEHYPTATGDARILFQYKEMSETAQVEGTIGIENHQENDGIEYKDDEDYDQYAHPIENGFCILFTTMTEAPQLTVDLTYVSGSPVPATGGNLNFEVFVENTGSSSANFDAWLDVSYEGGAPTTVIQRYLTGFQPGWTIDRPDAWFPVPEEYAAGNYMFYGRVGSHPAAVWAEDGFPFVKSGSHDGSFFKPFVPAQSFPDPFAVISGAEISSLEAVPDAWALGQNYPNPFNPLTTISFALPEAAQVKLTVYNVHGQVVTELLNGMKPAGFHEIFFDAAHLASGLYFYRIKADGFSAVKKMVLMK